MAVSVCILAVATVLPGGIDERHRLRGDVRTPGLPDLEEGFRLLGMNGRTLGLPNPGRGCRHQTRVDERTLGLPDPGGIEQESMQASTRNG